MGFADTIVKNAKIYTMDALRPWASAFAITEGRFVAIGSNEDVAPHIGQSTKIVDAKGAVILPGLIDGHAHAFEGARADLFELEISPSHDFDRIIAAVSDAVRHKRPGEWLIGGGWSAGKLLPQLAEESSLERLDEASQGHPTVLYDLSHHTAFANSIAMKIAGINEDSAVAGGTIVRYADGRPAGLFLETAYSLLEEASPTLSEDDRRLTALHATKLFNKHGVVGFAQALTSEVIMSTFKALDEKNELSAWIATYISMDTILTPARDGIGQPAVEKRAQYNSTHIAVDYVKFFMDGVPASLTAAFSKPYGGMSELVPSMIQVEALAKQIETLDAQGIHVKVHAIGDQAIRDTLDAIEIVRKNNGKDGPQHSIAHLSYIDCNDIPRLAALNVAADICPPLWFPNITLETNIRLLGEERGSNAWSIRDILTSGADVTVGTDWPAIAQSPNPWPGMAALITRQDPSNNYPGTFRPEQALTIYEALPLYTINVARSLGFSDQTGSIEAGKCADFIILDRDIFEIEPSEIKDVSIQATYFAGKKVYQA
jgi:predicted amidohydrolase YtcJ